MIIVKVMDIFSCNQIYEINNMTEIEEKDMCHLVAEGDIIRWQDLILFYFMYLVQLYNQTIWLRQSRSDNLANVNVGLSRHSFPSTEQIVGYCTLRCLMLAKYPANTRMNVDWNSHVSGNRNKCKQVISTYSIVYNCVSTFKVIIWQSADGVTSI